VTGGDDDYQLVGEQFLRAEPPRGPGALDEAEVDVASGDHLGDVGGIAHLEGDLGLRCLGREPVEPTRHEVLGDGETRGQAQVGGPVGPKRRRACQQGSHVAKDGRRPLGGGHARRSETGSFGGSIEQRDLEESLDSPKAHAGRWLCHPVRGRRGADRSQLADAHQQVERGQIRVRLGQRHKQTLEACGAGLGGPIPTHRGRQRAR
jgi:hypothetical protein